MTVICAFMSGMRGSYRQSLRGNKDSNNANDHMDKAVSQSTISRATDVLTIKAVEGFCEGAATE